VKYLAYSTAFSGQSHTFFVRLHPKRYHHNCSI